MPRPGIQWHRESGHSFFAAQHVSQSWSSATPASYGVTCLQVSQIKTHSVQDQRQPSPLFTGRVLQYAQLLVIALELLELFFSEVDDDVGCHVPG